MTAVNKSEIIAGLQSDILRLQGFKTPTSTSSNGALDFMKEAFPQGVFPLGVIHEFLSDAAEDLAAVHEGRHAPFDGFLDVGTGLVDEFARALEDGLRERGRALDVGVDAGIGGHGALLPRPQAGCNGQVPSTSYAPSALAINSKCRTRHCNGSIACGSGCFGSRNVVTCGV